jgi:hypothetical protein
LVAALWTLSMKRSVQLRKTWLLAPFTLVDMISQRLSSGKPAPRSGGLLIADGLTRYHEAGCPAVAGLVTSEVDRNHVPRGLSACRICGTP